MFIFQRQKGFTLVELVIVIGIIGILAAITIVVYNGIQDRGNETSVKVDLNNIAKQVEFYKTDLGHYPSTAEITTLKVKVNKTAYGVNPTGATGFYCVKSDGSAFSIVTRVKSLMILQYSSITGQSSEYSGSQTAPQLCTDSGISSASFLPFTEDGQWKSWISSN